MDLTLLSKNLLTDKQQDQSEADLLNSYQGFLSFIQKLSGVCVYFYSGDSYAYIANTAFLLQRLLLEEAGFQGEICLVYDKSDKVLCGKIRQNLPFFKDNRYSYAANAKQIKHPLILSGGGDQTDIFWQQLGPEVRYIITIRPYLDNSDFSFMKIRNEQGDWITYYTDTLLLNQYLADCNFYLNLKGLAMLTDEKKAYWKKLYGHLDLADAILQSSGKTIFTIDGASGNTALANRGENTILILSLAMLIQYQQTGRPCVLAVIGADSLKDRMFSLLQRFCDTTKDADAFGKALADLYPSAKEEDLRIGLLNPLLKKRTQLRPVLEKIAFTDKPEGFTKNNFCICALGEFPYDYTAALFAKSSYVFFESCDYTNLAVNLGIPYLQKSIETSAVVYPDGNAPQTARQMTKLCEIFSNDISAYTSASDKSLNEQIDAAAAFLKEPPADYFLSLSNFAQGKKDKTSEPSLAHDKLAASGSLFYIAYEELNHVSAGHMLYPRNNIQAADYEQFYHTLCSYYDEHTKTINLSAALSGMRIADYLKNLADNRDFILTLTSVDAIALDTDNDDEDAADDTAIINGVRVYGTCDPSGSLGGASLSIYFSHFFGEDNYQAKIHGKYNKPNSLAGLPWLTLEETAFDLTVSESNLPISGSISGIFGRSDTYYGVALCIDLNTQNGITWITADLFEPLTALDIFGAIAGGIDFSSLLPEELRPYVSLGLSQLKFSYNREEHKINSMSFTFENSSGNPWVIWEKDGKHLLTAKPSVSIEILYPADLSARQIQIAVRAFVDIGEPESSEEIGQLWLEASYPPFTAQMRMASERISLTKLLALFGCSIDADLDITQLNIFADFGSHSYLLSAAVGGEWKLCEQFCITGIGLNIQERTGNFSVSFAGSMKIFDKLQIAAGVTYGNGTWSLSAKAALAEQGMDITISDLIDHYKGNYGYIEKNEADNPLAAELSFTLTKHSQYTDFEIQALISQWDISLFEGESGVAACGAVGRKNGSFYAFLEADINLLGADMKIRLNYDTSTSFELIWGNFSGIVTKTKKETVAAVSITDLSIGYMVETFIRWLYGSGFSLDAPWDVLNNIRFHFQLIYNFTKKEFALSIGQTIDIGIGSINSLDITYNPAAKQKVSVQLSICYAWDSGNVQQLSWDASDPGTAPVPAGTGSSKFDLRYLAFGQKLRFFEKGYQPAHAQEAIDYLKAHTSPDQFPVYDESVGVLAAANFGILKENGIYFIDASLIFYDPALYAFSVMLDGPAAKVFAGFSFEIIYAKLSETLGVFKSTIVLPERFRKLELGIFSVTLPDFYIEVYTNGDFKIDIGFPKNGDFSRSFTLSGVVPPGLPLTGSAGLYFGKLSSATAEESNIHLPRTAKGTFDPAIVFGLGIRFGIGKSISYGILSGGFSLTASVILEGVIAKWLPHIPETSAPAAEPWYYYLEGVISLTGNIYGCIDFAIISASVNLTVNVTASFIYETCRAVLLTISAFVEASASLRINLGLFKISIGFHFKVQVKESFQLGSDTQAPWDENRLQANRNSLFVFPNAAPADIDFTNLTPKEIVNIKGNIALSVTAAADEYDSGKQYVLAALLMTIQDGEEFHKLAKALIYWVIAAACGKKTTQDELDRYSVSDGYLAALEAYFDQEETPVTQADAITFLTRFFTISVEGHAEAYQGLSENESVAGVYFPIPPQTEITVCYADTEQSKYTPEEYNTLSDDAAAAFKEMFHKLAVTVEQEQARKHTAPSSSCGLSVSSFLFCDWFSMAAKHIIRTMRLLLKKKAIYESGLGELLACLEKQQFCQELSGILSRYFLHGLRLPTTAENGNATHSLIIPKKSGLWVQEKNGILKLPKEAGIFALAGQEFQVYGGTDNKELLTLKLQSNNSFLLLPDAFELRISEADGSAEAVKKIAAYMPSFAISCALPEVEAKWLPAIFSFASPIKALNTNIWMVPDSLYQYFSKSYAVSPRFDFCLARQQENEWSQRKIDVKPLTLIEFSITKTEAKGVYLIGTAAARDIAILETLIKEKPEIENLQLMNQKDKLETFLSVSQINLSTDTRPPEMVQNRKNLELLQLLWKAFVTNNKGYVLTYRDASQTVLGDKVTLTISYCFSFEQAGTALPLINAAASEQEPAAGESLTAIAARYDYSIALKNGQEETPACMSPEKFIPADITARYCTNIRGIAQMNQNAVLNETVEWSFYDGSKVYTKHPNKGELLADFAKRNNTTPAYALWMNQTKASLFCTGQTIKIPVQAGYRAGSGSEITNSLINEHFLITRNLLPEIPAQNDPAYAKNVLENNYSLLCYGSKGQYGFSSPVSYKQLEKELQYDIAFPVDAYMGGSYRSCGRLFQNYFMWLDYYGNRLNQPFFTTRIAGYQDSLLGLSKWQSISAKWQPQQDTHNIIHVTLSFSADDYVDEAHKNNAFLLYSRLQKQIQDPNLTICLSCSMFEDSSDALDKTQILDMLEQILNFLQTGKIDTTDFTFAFSFADSPLSKLCLIPLECQWIMERKGCCGCGYEEVDSIIYTKSPVSLPENLLEFDRLFRGCFQGYLVLKSSGSSSACAYKISGLQIQASIETEALYLPAPFSNELVSSDNLAVKSYANGHFTDTEIKSCRLADLNIWMKNALRLLDLILSADIVSAAALTGCSLDKILSSKKAIAAKLSSMLKPVFKKSEQQIPPKEAIESFRQRLLANVSSYFEIKAVAALDADVEGLPENAVLYGGLNDHGVSQLSYSPLKLRNAHNQKFAFTISGQEIVLDKDSGAVLPGIELQQGLQFQASHIESSITPVIDGFHSSTWHGKLSENILEFDLCKAQTLKIPFPLYTFPELPQMVLQETLPAEDPYQWSYAFTYSRSYHYPQQMIRCSVKYNVSQNLNRNTQQDFLSALAQIDASGRDVYDDLQSLAGKVSECPDVLPDTVLAENFRSTFACAEAMYEALSQTNFHLPKQPSANCCDTISSQADFTVIEKPYASSLFSMFFDYDGIIPYLEGYTAEQAEKNTWIFKNENGYLSYANGQSIPKRKIIMPAKKILQYQNAVSELYVEQNHTLCDEDIQHAFIFTTGTVSFTSIINASCEVAADNLLQNEEKDKGKTLTQLLSQYFCQLCGNETITLQARGSYSIQLYENLEPIIHPVFMQTKEPVNTENAESTAALWAGKIKDWRKGFPYSQFSDKEQLFFELVFFTNTTQVPLLTVKKLYLPGEDIIL